MNKIFKVSSWVEELMDDKPIISDNFQIGPDGAFERLEIDKEKLHELYVKYICSKTTNKELKIIEIIVDILESNPELIK
jgi:hypothetical protein